MSSILRISVVFAAFCGLLQTTVVDANDFVDSPVQSEHDTRYTDPVMESGFGSYCGDDFPLPPEGAVFAEGCLPDDCWCWTDNLEFFAGLDGSKQPQDFGVNAQFGGRLHVNWAIPISLVHGIGLQAGTAVSQTDHAVAVTNAIEGSTSRTQSFTTIGIFQRTASGWTWSIVDDFLYQEDYDATSLMQLRGRIGYDLNSRDEVGIFGMTPLMSDDANWAGNPVRLRSLAQGSLFWRHQWASGGQTTGWLGLSEGHGQANAALGDREETGVVPVFGADLHLPLNDYCAIYGEANFVTPADTGTVDAFLGIVFYPGRGAVLWRERRFSPVLPVASSPSMSVNLTR